MAPDSEPRCDGGGLGDFYDELCKGAREAMLDATVNVSPYLDDLARDRRLGLTLIVRPSADVAKALETVTSSLQTAAPGLLFPYDRARFHFTILSLIDAHESFHLEEYVLRTFEKPIQEVAPKFLPFSVTFRGVCATPSAIIAKGYPESGGLERLRGALREKLHSSGLGAGIDRRYRIEGAHVVLARFREQGDFRELITLLDTLKEAYLGRMWARQAQLVCNDFYMSPQKVQTKAVIPKPSRQVVHNLPSPAKHFFGRHREIDRVLGALRGSGPGSVVYGFGGIGKSELAKKVSWECVASRWPFSFVCWVDVRSYESSPALLGAILDDIARAADPDSEIPSIWDEEEKARRVAATLQARRSLLILDNYEDVRRSEEEERKVVGFLSGLQSGTTVDGDDGCVRVLVTSREPLGSAVPSIDCLQLSRLPFDDADQLMQSLLDQFARCHNRGLDPGQRRLVWENVHGVPHLIVWAMHQLQDMTFDEWIARVQVPLGMPDEMGAALFNHSWDHLFSENMKRMLMALAHFVGGASQDALRIVSGVALDAFLRELARALGAYIERTGAGYTAHPVAMFFYSSKLRESTQAAYRIESGRRFVEWFRDLAEYAARRSDFDKMEREMRNIFAAARLAASLAKDMPTEQGGRLLEDTVRLQTTSANCLWLRGLWSDYEALSQLAAEAADELQDERLLGRLLCYDLAWLALRREDVELVEKRVGRGIVLAIKLGDAEGIAMAKRHLGKAALLQGLDKTYYEPGETWEDDSRRASTLYSESLKLRESLHEEGNAQDEEIADLKLDLGRLFWLDGQSAEREGKPTARERYERSYRISREALDSYHAIGSERGRAKAWGNCGNASRQMAASFAKARKLRKARQWAYRAQEFYTKSLELAQSILRRDEIAHAYWGLAETLVLHAALTRDTADCQQRTALLKTARRFAEESHRVYRALAGPRDVHSTERLRVRICGELSQP